MQPSVKAGSSASAALVSTRPGAERAMSRRALLASVAASSAAVALGACSPTASNSSSTDESVAAVPLMVALIGDSISSVSRVPLEAALASKGFGRIEFDAQPGRRILEGERPGVAVLDEELARGIAPDLWVIQLGSNDLGLYPDAVGMTYPAVIQEVLRRLDAATPLVWVDTYSALFMTDTWAFNAALHEAVRLRGNAVVARWYDRCTADPQLVPDGLHPVAATAPTFAETTVEPIGILT